MALVNEHFLKLPGNYLFADIAKRVNAFKVSHPKVNVISLGIGDVTRPLAPVVIEAMHKAVDEMANKATFRGYGPEREVTTSCARLFRKTISCQEASTSISTRSSSTTVLKATPVTFRRSCAGTTTSA